MMAKHSLSTPPPLAPPRTSGELVSWLRQIRSHRVGTTTFHRLLAEHGSADAALEALPSIASSAGVAKYTPFPEDAAHEEIAAGKKLGARFLCHGAPEYPSSLAEIPDPPPLLWALGDIDLLNRSMIAMVGARNASSLGTRMAKGLATDLAVHGFVIVSGLARGVDTAAHLASLQTGTVAVQAGGLDAIYPSENLKLHEDIAASGLRLSEQPIGMTPHARHFPRRNRLVSGLSRAVVIVEAAMKSGSLITAKDAAEQGREVLAVPGHPLDNRAAGCNALIRDGATLVRSAQDVMEAIGPAQPDLPLTRPDPAPTRDNVHDHGVQHAQILGLLGPSPMAEDQLIRDLALPAQAVLPHLTTLEIEGKITRQPGGLLARIV